MDLRLDPERLTSMYEPLDPELAQRSAIHGRPIFVLASRESGGELLLRSLGQLPGVAFTPVGTHVFSQGIDYVTKNWLVGQGIAPEGVEPVTQGLSKFVSPQEFLGAVRLLADAPLQGLLASSGADRVVEYSFGHIHYGGLISSLYPDAHIVHLVRDGRQVASRLVTHPHLWSHREATDTWIRDQATLLADDPPRHTVRLEDLHADPMRSLSDLTKLLEIPATDEDLERAAVLLRSGGSGSTLEPGATALVEVLGSDLLEHFGYQLGPPTPTHRRARRDLAVERATHFVGRNVRKAYDRVAAWTEDDK